jgi:hypothetical protein
VTATFEPEFSKMGRGTCDTLKNFENPPEISGFASQTLRKGATSPTKSIGCSVKTNQSEGDWINIELINGT